MKLIHTIERIKALPWHRLNRDQLLSLMVLSGYAATEFAASLRIAIYKVLPEHKGLRDMAQGELQTDNLVYDDYHMTGDHASFIWHFVRRYDLITFRELHAGKRYFAKVNMLDARTRAASVVSRERELPGIFTKILETPAEHWDHPALKAYQYFLRRHIELDTGDCGHDDLTSDIEVPESVRLFYEARYELYKPVFPTIIK